MPDSGPFLCGSVRVQGIFWWVMALRVSGALAHCCQASVWPPWRTRLNANLSSHWEGPSGANTLRAERECSPVLLVPRSRHTTVKRGRSQLKEQVQPGQKGWAQLERRMPKVLRKISKQFVLRKEGISNRIKKETLLANFMVLKSLGYGPKQPSDKVNSSSWVLGCGYFIFVLVFYFHCLKKQSHFKEPI